MHFLNSKHIAGLFALSGMIVLTTTPVHAQSTEEVLGAIIGGTAGAVIGGEVDNKGSNSDGKVIGAVIGGSLGYVIGSGLDDDGNMRKRYSSQPGEFYVHNGQAYRRYPDSRHRYVSVRVSSGDPYYYSDGRKKSHPVFRNNPGKAKGRYKR